MNRFTKGTIAIGAAVALLLGGAGSLAYWQQTDTISSGSLSFQTGELKLITQGETWTINGVSKTRDEAADMRLVPGSTVVYTKQYSVDKTADDLHVTFSAAIGGLNAVNIDETDVTTDAFDGVIVPSVQITGDPVQYTSTPGEVYLKSAGSILVTITLAWPYGSADSSEATMSKAISLTDTVITLKQVPEAPADPCAC
ncbi:alternate-type signal peptide domain-containing protein [Plantibacter flavus]|uniref:alternate-type signal peptide domain-containing protein n=1 Tax=Plantibacter flavus TaxID=150123 RepID=UPI003F17C3C8